MLDLLLQYGLFLAKTVTVVMAVVVIIIAISNVGSRRRLMQEEGDLEVVALNDRYDDYADAMREAVFDKDDEALMTKAKRVWLLASGKKVDFTQDTYSIKFTGLPPTYTYRFISSGRGGFATCRSNPACFARSTSSGWA